MADLTRTIEVKPLALHIGAEILGVDLGRPLDMATRKAINDAFLRWKVVFFRGQHLDHRGHVAFARQMGEPTIGHAVFGHIEDFPEIYSVAKFRTAQTNRGSRPQRPWTGWHTDITAALNPSQGFHPSRRDHSTLRRRHVLDQSGGGLPGSLGNDAWHR